MGWWWSRRPGRAGVPCSGGGTALCLEIINPGFPDKAAVPMALWDQRAVVAAGARGDVPGLIGDSPLAAAWGRCLLSLWQPEPTRGQACAMAVAHGGKAGCACSRSGSGPAAVAKPLPLRKQGRGWLQNGRAAQKKPCGTGASCHLVHPTVARGPQTVLNLATYPALLTAALSLLRSSEQRAPPRAGRWMGIRCPRSLSSLPGKHKLMGLSTD